RFVYQVPDTNQCASCHAADFGQQRIVPIGVKARHLNRDVAYPNATENQLAHWARNEILSDLPDGATAPSSAQWNDARQDLNARARAYLDINCGHCHSATAAANTSGLLLDATTTDPARLGRCKVPVATGRGSGTGVFDIVPGTPDESILLQRMISTEPDIAMPEIGRALVHEEGVALIRAWIAAMPGDCASPRAIREECPPQSRGGKEQDRRLDTHLRRAGVGRSPRLCAHVALFAWVPAYAGTTRYLSLATF